MPRTTRRRGARAPAPLLGAGTHRQILLPGRCARSRRTRARAAALAGEGSLLVAPLRRLSSRQPPRGCRRRWVRLHRLRAQLRRAQLRPVLPPSRRDRRQRQHRSPSRRCQRLNRPNAFRPHGRALGSQMRCWRQTHENAQRTKKVRPKRGETEALGVYYRAHVRTVRRCRALGNRPGYAPISPILMRRPFGARGVLFHLQSGGLTSP